MPVKMDTTAKIERLEQFKALLKEWQARPAEESRSSISQSAAWVRRELIEVGCFGTVSIAPPAAVGGMILRNVDPFELIFNPPYGRSVIPTIIDWIDRAIGIFKDPEYEAQRERETTTSAQGVVEQMEVQAGYVFIAMPINPDDAQLEDVLDAIKDAASRCSLLAERVDEVHSSERITDRILESIRKAEFVVADLTGARPNVFYEAGYAQGLGKTPIYIARDGTKLEFDLKDYPIIFFRGMRDLKEKLSQRLQALAQRRTS